MLPTGNVHFNLLRAVRVCVHAGPKFQKQCVTCYAAALPRLHTAAASALLLPQYFPSLSQPIGEVSQDSIQIYALPTETDIATTPTLSFKGTFGCITRANDLTTLKTSTTSTATLYDELLQYVNTCPPPVFAPANCTTDTGTPATCSYGINATCPSLASWDGPPTTAGELQLVFVAGGAAAPCRWVGGQAALNEGNPLRHCGDVAGLHEAVA